MDVYGVDIRDVFRDDTELTPELALCLIAGLSYDSSFVAARRGGPQFRHWGPDQYALVASADGIRELGHMYLLSHLGKRISKPKPPAPFPTPEKHSGTARRPKTGSFAGIAASMLVSSRKRKAAHSG